MQLDMLKKVVLSIFLKSTGSGEEDALTETFTFNGDGGIKSQSLVLNGNNGSGDVSISFQQNDTNKYTIGIDDGDNDIFKINPGAGGIDDPSAFEMDSSGNVTINGVTTFNGNTTINGDLTTISSTNTIIRDNLIELNNGVAENANDSGIVIERGTAGDNAFMGWDESADVFILGTTTATGNSTGDLDITAGDLTVADFTAADITADNLKVAEKANALGSTEGYGQIWVKILTLLNYILQLTLETIFKLLQEDL